jgi:Domain of unknown function (DUF4365)
MLIGPVKHASRQTKIGEAGVAMIVQRVSDMEHLWHPTSGADSGIDGEIELRDPATGEVRNVRVGVQSKATEGLWRSETDDGFLYKASPKDIDYWLSSNQPVILVCSRPKKNEAYWRDVHDWAADPARRSTGLIDFDKHRDRFDADAAARFFTLESREPLQVDPPGPLEQTEVVQSNLLPITWETDRVWSVSAPGDDWSGIFRRALDSEVARTDVTLRGGRLWSLSPLDKPYLEAIGADVPVVTALNDLVDSAERDDQFLLADCARRSLLSHHHRELRWSGLLRAAYFRLWSSQPNRKYKWGRGSGRTVVLPRQSPNHDGLSGYRHDAAQLVFRQLGGHWVMSINPTYLFTFDGVQVSSFHSEALKKMKEQDRAQAVSQQLRMWATFFTRPQLTSTADALPFSFGPLLEMTVPVSPPEAAWKNAPADTRTDEVDHDHEPPMTLFDAA